MKLIHALVIVAVACCTTNGLRAAEKPAGPLLVFILAGQSNMEGQGRISEGKQATLELLVKNDFKGRYKHLVDPAGNWAVRKDVWTRYNRKDGAINGGLAVGQGANPKKFGPELQIGHVLGEQFQNPVLLVKTCWGGKSLQVDFRPPGAGLPPAEVLQEQLNQINKQNRKNNRQPLTMQQLKDTNGRYYRLMIKEIDDTLKNLKTTFPEYDARQGYRIAGFFWWQGWNDACIGREATDAYTDNLAHLISDVRGRLKTPNLPVVIATSGNGGDPPTINDTVFMRIHNELVPAQRAVATRPQFKGSVAVTETWDYWRGPQESPADAGHHWNDNAESYFLVGDAMGKRMVELLKGKRR